jgi:uncharacterized membrane protein required for colicin V production
MLESLSSWGANWGQPALVGWFDIAAVGVLTVGLIQGRRRGISGEMLSLFQWLAIVIGGAYLYEPLGRLLAVSAGMGLLTAYIGSYLFVALTVKLIVSTMQRAVGEKITGSDVFGKSEYYLGMGAGAVRGACILLFAMALLNAKHIPEEQRRRFERMQQENFGTIRFPTIAGLQQDVFDRSSTGVFTRRYLRDQLIEPTAPTTGGPAHNPKRRGQDSMLDDLLNKKG